MSATVEQRPRPLGFKQRMVLQMLVPSSRGNGWWPGCGWDCGKHTAQVLEALVQRGLVARSQRLGSLPPSHFYTLTDAGRAEVARIQG